MSSVSVQRFNRSDRLGALSARYCTNWSPALSPDTTNDSKSALKMSRTMRKARSGSECSLAGAFDFLELAWMRFQVSDSCSTSRVRSSSLAPSAAVRTMMPAPSGTIRRRMLRNRLRSLSGSFRLIPVMEPSGT